MLVLYCGTDGNQGPGNTSGGVGEGSTTNGGSTRGGSSGGRGSSSGGSGGGGTTSSTTGGTTGGPPILCSAHKSSSCEEIDTTDVTDCPHLSTLTLSKEIYTVQDYEPGIEERENYRSRYLHLDYRMLEDRDDPHNPCFTKCPDFLINYRQLRSPSKQAKSNPRQDTILIINGEYDGNEITGASVFFNARRLNYDSSKEYYIFYKREPAPTYQSGHWGGVHRAPIRMGRPEDICPCERLPDVGHSQQVFGTIKGGIWNDYGRGSPPSRDITIKVWLAYQDDDNSPCHFYRP